MNNDYQNWQGGFPNLKRCSRCIMPETWESINFDENGVCNICRNSEIKQKIDWQKKRQEFVELITQYKGKGLYDCIVPYSGGKDSTFTLYSLVKDFGLKPLVVSFDHWYYRPKILANRVSTQKILGVDCLTFRTDWQVVKKLMRESLERKGDFHWHAHTGCFALPMQMAVRFEVPLVIWGEPSSEYTAYYAYDDNEEIDERHFNRLVNLGINAEDMVGMIKGVTMRDLEPYRYPSLKELKEIGCRSVCLGSYIPWDVRTQAQIIHDQIGWQGDAVENIPPQYWWEKVEDLFQGTDDYLKFIKRGLGRTCHLTSIDIRNGRMTREEAIELTKRYDGLRPASLEVFLDYLGMTEKEFNQIVLSHQVAPYQHDFSKTVRGPELWDQKLWDKTKC